LIFCPECESRAIPMNKSEKDSKFKCVRPYCGKEFKPKNE